MDVHSKARENGSAIAHLRSQGCMKALFPRRSDWVDAIVINTAGGLTGGDKLDIDACVGAGSRMSLTTQAAERAYKASADVARVSTKLCVEDDARMHWLPQELILFEDASLKRRLQIALQGKAELLMVEPVVFGRVAMGEELTNVQFQDRIEIRRDGVPLYMDALNLTGDLRAQMARVAGGAGAMASVVLVAPNAEAHLEPLRKLLPESGGASLLAEDLLALRLLASDSFELRRALLPILDRLSGDRLPTSWRL